MKLIKQIEWKVLIMSEEIIKKEDGRVRYTKMRIRSAFYELLHEMDYEKITVTAVCKRAEINRATFYKHYLDVADLVDKLQEETLNELSQKLQDAIDDNAESFIVDMLKFLKAQMKNNDGVKLFSISATGTFTSKISTLIYLKFASFLEPRIPSNSEYSKDIVFAYIAGGCAGIIDYWVKSGYKENEEAIAAKLTALASSTINSL